MSTTLNIEQLVAALKGLSSALICTHISPDPDAIGSSCGLQRGLARLGVDCLVYLSEPVPERILPLVEGVPFTLDVPERKFSAVIVVDTASRKRVGHDMERLLAAGERVINIDHHASNEGWGDDNYISAESAAAAEIVYGLLKHLGAPIDKQTACLLYAGILDDTGSFCYSNVNESCLRAAAELVALGAAPEDVSNALYFSVPERVLKMRAAALSNLRIVLGGRAAVIRITLKELEECGAKVEDTEGLVDIARSVLGTEAAVFYRELPDGWKFSLRAKGPRLDVNKVAARFGGGGHRAAAGLTVRLPGDQAERAVLAELERELDAL